MEAPSGHLERPSKWLGVRGQDSTSPCPRDDLFIQARNVHDYHYIIVIHGRLWEKLEFIASATKQHAFNLAKFVTIYKTFRVVLSILVPEYKDYHAFVAGSIGGYLVFRQDNPVNNQIVMYLLARVSVGLVKLMFERTFPSSIVSKEGGHQLNNLIKFIADHGFEIEATVVWGLVMWLFTAHRHVLQPSLQASMDYLYVDSDSWESWWTLFIHNKKPKSE